MNENPQTSESQQVSSTQFQSESSEPQGHLPHASGEVFPAAEGSDSQTRNDTQIRTGTHPDVPIPTSEPHDAAGDDSDEDFWKTSTGAFSVPKPKQPAQDTGYEDVDDSAHPSEEEGNTEAEINFQKANKAFKRRERSGKLTAVDAVQWERLKKEEEMRRARILQEEAREASDGENDLFVPNSEVHPGINLQVPSSRPRPRGRPPGRSKRAAPKFEIDDDPTHPAPLETPDTARKRPAKIQGESKSKKAKTNDGASRKDKAKAKQAAKRSAAQERREGNLFNNASLVNGSLFEDVATNRARSTQPTFASRNKTDALRELVANIPAESRPAARIDKHQLLAASKKFTGRGSCYTAENGEWKVRGMRSNLTHYQMLGVSVMREREAEMGDSSPDNVKPAMQPAGGILADQMGLGKTVMAIANIVNDRHFDRKQRHRHPKPTLIVAPSSIIFQWMAELVHHAYPEILGSVMQFNSSAEVTTDEIDMLLQQGVVMTTYQQVQKSFPKRKPPVECVTLEQKQAWWNTFYEENKGPLHRVHWRRVVLDEATAIKNHLSQTSQACAELAADFRWALTGTPVMNSLSEFYAYFKFLKAPNTHSFDLFKRNFMRDGDALTGNERLVAFLRPFMIRRTHNDEMFGAKLLVLPTPHRDTYFVHFTPLHRALYSVVRQRFIEKINVMSSKGDIKRQYRSILTLILRLRQLAGHPLLIHDTMCDLLEDSDFAKIDEILVEASNRPAPDAVQPFLISHLRRMMKSRRHLVPMEPEYSSKDLEAFLNNPEIPETPETVSSQTVSDSSQETTAANPEYGRAFGMKDDFGDFMTEVKVQSKLNNIHKNLCVRCSDRPAEPILTTCGHFYCDACNQQDTQEALENGNEFNACHSCGAFYTTTENFDPEITATETQQPAAQEARNTGTRKTNPLDQINKWITADGAMVPSAKTTAFKAQMLNWVAESPNVKIIVYSQFHTMIKILTKVCQIEGWNHLTYHGQQTMKARNNTITKFTRSPKACILLASLRTGGVGLNLTAANRVLMVDPWWNTAVEEQAFCRTYRRGQEKETAMMRLVVQGSVDEHIVALQEKKDKVIEKVMAQGSRDARLEVEDLLKLFGGKDGDGGDGGGAAEFVFA